MSTEKLREALPKNAAEVRAFIGSNFNGLRYGVEGGEPSDDDIYELSAHDLLSAFSDLEALAQPSPPSEQADRAGLVDVKRWFLNPETGMLVQTERGPWVRYVDVLDALAAQPATAQVVERCRLCDNTGDIHDATGEWRGECPYCSTQQKSHLVSDLVNRVKTMGDLRRLESDIEEAELCDEVVAFLKREPATEQVVGGEPIAWTIAGDVTNWARDFSKYRTQHYVRPVFDHPPVSHEQQQAGAVVESPKYRLLQRNVDKIMADDEFLSEDASTWAVDPNGIFVGMTYGGMVLRPARRALKAGGVA